ncbi:MAG: hypothetical protein WCS37_10215 [Chloroflexota bacterium]
MDADTITPLDYLLKEAQKSTPTMVGEDGLPLAVAPTLDSAQRAVRQLENARLELALLFGGAFDRHLVSKGEDSRQILLRSTTGTGKTTAALNQIVSHLALGRPGRILYLTDTKQAYAHLLGSTGVLEEARQLGRVAVREGRTELPGDYHCERMADCLTLGANRQPTSADVCGTCPFGSAASWKAYAEMYEFDPEEARHFECEKFGYLASVRRCKQAQVVIAPKAAILNGSSELGEFDFVIIDEDCVGFLLECQELGSGQLSVWEDGRRRLELAALVGPEVLAESETTSGPASRATSRDQKEAETVSVEVLRERHEPFDKLLSLVRAALTDFELAGKEACRARFMPVLKARVAMQGGNLESLVEECLAISPSRHFRRYAWEKPYRNHLAGIMVAPLRFARDLVELLARELDGEEGGDTRLWIERRSGGGAAIVAYLPRQHLIDILSGQKGVTYENEFKKPPTVFYLDATAGPVFHLAVPRVEEVEIKVRQPLYVIQTTNSLYTGRSLEGDGGKGLDKISRAIGALAGRFGCKRPVVFSRKVFNPDSKTPDRATSSSEQEGAKEALKVEIEGVRYGHFERHNKGLDDYADADLLAVVGHYSQPLDEITAQVEAFRGRKNALEPTERGGSWQLKAYGWRGADGKGLARWCKANPDPEIQAAIEHSTVATIMQTIGRGRAALRASDQPLVVALFTSLPLPNLVIDELTAITDILEESRISEKQAEALAAGREGLNTQRRAETIAKIEATRQEVAATGQQYMAPQAFARLAEVSRSSLRSLGYAIGGRWIRMVNIPETISQEIYISLLSNPVSYKLESNSSTEANRANSNPLTSQRAVSELVE